MKFFENTTIDGLQSRGIPTFDACEHYYVEPHPNTKQTLVVNLGNDKYLTVNINPESDNVDVKCHGEHSFKDFGTIKAFYNMAGSYPNQPTTDGTPTDGSINGSTKA